jgi:hypothetical protein
MLSEEQTILHELREIIENGFLDFGHPILTAISWESRAEEFARAVRIAGSAEAWESLGERAINIESTWKSLGFLVLILAGRLLWDLWCFMLPVYEDFLLKAERQTGSLKARRRTVDSIPTRSTAPQIGSTPKYSNGAQQISARR